MTRIALSRPALAGLLAAALFSGGAQAAPSCADQASEKKLAGAAKTSFLKKCEAEAGAAPAPAPEAACQAQAEGKKLAGAARSSFVKKCVADAAAK